MRLRRVIWNPWQAMGSLEEWRIKALKHFCHKQSGNAKGKQRGFSHGALLMTVTAANFGALPDVQILHTICHLKAWEVNNPMPQTVCNLDLKWGSYSRWKITAPSWRKKDFSKVLRNQHFCCGMVSQPFCTVLWSSPEASRRDGSQTPQDGSPLCKGVESAGCCEEISQPFLYICKISQTSFSPAKWSWSFPIVVHRLF